MNSFMSGKQKERFFSLAKSNKNKSLEKNRSDIEGSLSSLLTIKLERPQSKEKCYLQKSNNELLQNAKEVTIKTNTNDHTYQTISLISYYIDFNLQVILSQRFCSLTLANSRKLCCFYKFNISSISILHYGLTPSGQFSNNQYKVKTKKSWFSSLMPSGNKRSPPGMEGLVVIQVIQGN